MRAVATYKQKRGRSFLLIPMSAFSIGGLFYFVLLSGEAFAEQQFIGVKTSSFKHTVIFWHANIGEAHVVTKMAVTMMSVVDKRHQSTLVDR